MVDYLLDQMLPYRSGSLARPSLVAGARSPENLQDPKPYRWRSARMPHQEQRRADAF